jgi:hypothetical protein
MPCEVDCVDALYEEVKKLGCEAYVLRRIQHLRLSGPEILKEDIYHVEGRLWAFIVCPTYRRCYQVLFYRSTETRLLLLRVCIRRGRRGRKVPAKDVSIAEQRLEAYLRV